MPVGTEQEVTENYAEDTPLTYIFGENARVQILAAMLSEKEHDLNVSDIARMAGVARSTVYDHLDEMRQMDLVVKTREIGGAPMYQINTESQLVEYIDRLEGLALEKLLEEGM